MKRGVCICGHLKSDHKPACTANVPHPWRNACPCKGFKGQHSDEQDEEER